MNARSDESDGPRILVDTPPRLGAHVIDTTFRREFQARIDTAFPPALWVYGPDGIGKTTTVSLALPSSRPVARIRCDAGVRLEEALYKLSRFFLQHGEASLHEVLDQRSSLASKVGVLLEAVSRHEVVIWFDDFHHLECGVEEGEVDTGLLDRLLCLPATSAGSVVVTSRERAPDLSDLVEFIAPTIDETEREAFSTTLGASCADARTPLEALLRSNLSVTEEEDSVSSLTDDSLELLSKEQRVVLEIIAAFHFPIRRRALLDLCESRDDLVLGEPETEATLDELRETGFIEADFSRESWRCAVHPALRDDVAAWFRTRDGSEWTSLVRGASVFYLELGGQTGGIWDLYRAHTLLHREGLRDESSNTTRLFLEELLKRGYFELASMTLSRTVRDSQGAARAVALGNQAMIHKNLGDFDRALALYLQARTELDSLGDRANVARVLHQIGNTLYLKQDCEGALNAYRESYDLSRDLGEGIVATATRVQIANILWTQGNASEAIQHYEESLQDLDDEQSLPLKAAVLLQLGQVYLQQKLFVEADNSFSRGVEVAQSCNDQRSTLKAYRGLAAVSREQLEFDRARSYFDLAIDTAHRLGDTLELLDCWVARSELDKRQGHFTGTYEDLLQASALLIDLQQQASIPDAELETLRAAVAERVQDARTHLDEETLRRLDEAFRLNRSKRVG